MPFDVVGPMIFPYSLVMDAPQLDIAMHEAETADVHKSTLRVCVCVCVCQSMVYIFSPGSHEVRQRHTLP